MKYFFYFFLFFSISIYSEIIFDFEKGTDGWVSFVPEVEVYQSSKFPFSGEKSLCLEIKNSDKVIIGNRGNFDFSNFDSLSFRIYHPEETGTNANITFYLKDDEYHWFETEKVRILRGEARKIKFKLSDAELKSISHLKKWDSYVARNIKEMGIIIEFDFPYSGFFYLDDFEADLKQKNFFIYDFRISSKNIPEFGKFEITFQLPFSFSNPFDPEIKINGVFTFPDGKKVIQPAFFYHDYLRVLQQDGENVYSYGKHEWKIRFCPDRTGRYLYGLEIIKNGDRQYLECGDFFVYETNNKGFLKWDENDPMYLSFSNGEFFYPVGHTLRSPDDERQPYNYKFVPEKNLGTFAYDRYFKKMVENKENYTRMWTTAWWLGLEWSNSYSPYYKGIGKYNLKNAWQLDYILDLAEKYGIYIDLTLINHGQFSIRPDAEWWDNPYNEINGGFLSSPDEFFVNEKAIDFFKKRLNYIISRWAHSTSIAFWELWNEVDLTGYYDTEKIRYWHKKIVPYIRQIDNYGHPVSTHYCRRNQDPLVWIIPEISSIVGNAYSSQIVTSILEFYKERKPFVKPISINEFGVGKNRWFLENNMHGGIWASSMTPMFGVALFWWWPFIDYYNLYYHYLHLANFWEGEDRRNKKLQLSDAEITGNRNIGIIGIQNDCIGFFWIYDRKIFDTSVKREKFIKLENAKVEVKHLKDGIYNCQFWNTYNGKIVEKYTLQTKDGKIEIDVPEFYGDIALKIKNIK